MWRIIINGPGYFDTQYDLPEGITHLGRADENDIVLSGDLVSRRHARLKVSGNALVVEDLSSRNGSKLNGQAFRGASPLKPGDVVTIGENTFSVRQPSAAEDAATEMVDLGAGGVRRYGGGGDLGTAVVVTRELRDSVVRRALDNVAPFETDLSMVPFGEPERQVSWDWLLTLYKVAEKLSSAKSLQELLDETADRLLERVGATTAVVLLRHHSGVLVPAAVRHQGRLARGEVPVSDAIIEAALRKGAALAVTGVKDDERFRGRDSVILYGIEQVLCVPIKVRDHFVGVFYLNRPSGDARELDGLLDLLSAVAHLISSGIEKFRVAERGATEQRLRKALERFHAPDIVERRLAELGRAGGGPLTQMEERTCTILFADIAGFTAVTQRSRPERVVQLLNEFYQRMTRLIFSFEGTVDKFMGDSVMAIFGAPYARGEEPVRAVRTALAMRDEWARAVSQLPAEERCQLRIGLHTGKVLAGTVGSEARLDYTAVGETVNIAWWLTASAHSGQVLISGKTLAAVGARFDVAPLGERVLRRDREGVAVFEVIEEDVGQNTLTGHPRKADI